MFIFLQSWPRVAFITAVLVLRQTLRSGHGEMIRLLQLKALSPVWKQRFPFFRLSDVTYLTPATNSSSRSTFYLLEGLTCNLLSKVMNGLMGRNPCRLKRIIFSRSHSLRTDGGINPEENIHQQIEAEMRRHQLSYQRAAVRRQAAVTEDGTPCTCHIQYVSQFVSPLIQSSRLLIHYLSPLRMHNTT